MAFLDPQTADRAADVARPDYANAYRRRGLGAQTR
jgi:hypothetical protein